MQNMITTISKDSLKQYFLNYANLLTKNRFFISSNYI